MDYEKVDHETVAWATENARQLLRDESERVRALDGKSAQLAGFAGVILAILGSIAPDAFKDDLGCVGDIAFGVTYFLAAGSLTASILWLVFWALKPQRFVALDAVEIEKYLTDDRLLQAKPWALQIRTLRALSDAATWAQDAAEQKANRLTVGVVMFAVGLGAALGAVVTLGASTP